jgi:hypothetical protein
MHWVYVKDRLGLSLRRLNSILNVSILQHTILEQSKAVDLQPTCKCFGWMKAIINSLCSIQTWEDESNILQSVNSCSQQSWCHMLLPNRFVLWRLNELITLCDKKCAQVAIGKPCHPISSLIGGLSTATRAALAFLSSPGCTWGRCGIWCSKHDICKFLYRENLKERHQN